MCPELSILELFLAAQFFKQVRKMKWRTTRRSDALLAWSNLRDTGCGFDGDPVISLDPELHWWIASEGNGCYGDIVFWDADFLQQRTRVRGSNLPRDGESEESCSSLWMAYPV
jgi:hypothetical protein